MDRLKSIEERHGYYLGNTDYKLMDYDEAMIDTWDKIEETIRVARSDTGKKIANFKNVLAGTTDGVIQSVGGWTETLTGYGIASAGVATAWTGVTIPAVAGGGYLCADGASNVAGGVSKIINSIKGNDLGDSANLMKILYKKAMPQDGEYIYNCTELGIALFTINKGVTELPKDTSQVFSRAKNIQRAESEGLKVHNDILSIGDQVVITTKTDDGMILKKTVIDKNKLAVNVGSIGVDVYNAEGTESSIK